MTHTRLTDDQITAALAGLPGWSLADGKLQREIKFADFATAFAFMTRVALWTHDAGGITPADVELARAVSVAAV